MKHISQNPKPIGSHGAFFVFLTLGLTILLAAHFFVWFTLIDFFSFGFAARVWLAALLFLLAISFLLANLLERRFKNAAVKTFYFLSAVWLGFFVNLIFSFIFLWLALWLFRSLSVDVSKKFLVEIFGLLAAGVTLWGMYRAYHPLVRWRRLKISNLPAAWRDKKIVHLSDLHLGLSNGPAFLEKIIKLTNAQKPDLIFITGDLFDGSDGDLNDFVPLLNRLEASVGIYFVTGNHETYLGLAEVHSALAKTKICVLDNRAEELSGLRVIGLSYPPLGEKEDVTAVLKKISDPDRPQLLLFHAPTHLREFSKLGIDVLFCGHTHQGQIFPFGYITRAIFHGHDRGLTRQGQMRIYVSAGTATWGPPVKTSGRTEIAVFTLI